MSGQARVVSMKVEVLRSLAENLKLSRDYTRDTPWGGGLVLKKAFMDFVTLFNAMINSECEIGLVSRTVDELSALARYVPNYSRSDKSRPFSADRLREFLTAFEMLIQHSNMFNENDQVVQSIKRNLNRFVSHFK